MDDTDGKWVSESITDPLSAQTEDFKSTVIFSTDGKHSVIIEAETKTGRASGLRWGKAVYEKIKYTYGTKQSQEKKEFTGEKDLGTCPKCGAANAISQKGKIYCSAKCWLKE